MKTCKCPRCGTVANFVSAKPIELPSWPVGIPSKWPNATEHLIGGKRCLRLRLTRSEERRTFLMNALGDFRCVILHDKHFTDKGREAILGHLDDAFSPVQGVNPTTEAGHDHDWLCDACGHWNGPNLAKCAMCVPSPFGYDT